MLQPSNFASRTASDLRRVETCPPNVTHHNPRGSRSLVPGSLQTDLSGRLSGSNVEQIGPLADIELYFLLVSLRNSPHSTPKRFVPSSRFRMAMSSSLHRGYRHRLPTIRILLYSLCGTQCPECALQHYGVLQITMGELILHSMTHATFDSATNIASSMYQTAMWSPIHPSSVKTWPLEEKKKNPTQF